jgi:hypothetical protein
MIFLRLLLCALVFAAAIALDWHRLMEALGQGSHVVAAGWFGIPLGAMVIGMGLMIPVVGLGASLLVARLLRVRETIRPEDPRSLHAHVAAQAIYALALLAVSMAMWRLFPPQASEYARFGQAFFVTSGLLALSFCTFGAMLVASTLLRQPLSAGPT